MTKASINDLVSSSNNSSQGNPMSNFINMLSKYAQPVADFAENNPVSKFLIGGAMNTAHDIGTGLGVNATPGTQQSADTSFSLANQARKKAMTTTDPAEKQRLLTVAGNAFDTNAQNSQQQAKSYSPDVSQNPIQRGLTTGVQVATGADIAAHPVQTVQSIGNIILHPIKAIQGLRDIASEALNNPIGLAKDAIDNPMNFKLDRTSNGLNKLGNRWLLGQYKNADEVARNPLDVVTNLKSYGLSNPQSISDAAKVITGNAETAGPAEAIVHRKVLNAVANADPVDTAGIIDNARSLMEQSTNITGSVEQKALNTVEKGLQGTTGNITKYTPFLNNELESGAQAGLTGNDPEKIFQFTRTLDQKAAMANNAAYDKAGNLTNATQQELSQFYRGISSELKNRLFTGVTSDPNIMRLGADNMKLGTSWTPQELAAFKGIGNGKVANDIIGQDTVGGLRKIESLFTQGGRMADQVISAGEKSPSLTQMAAGLSTALHPNPIGPGVFAASTRMGKEALGNSLNTLGDITAGAPSATLKGSILTQGLPPIVASQNNQNNQNSNPDQVLPPTSGITPPTPVVKPIKYSDLPTDSTQVTSDMPLTPPTMISDKNGNPLAMAKTDNTSEELSIQNQMKDPSVLYNPVAYNKLNQRLSQLQAIDKQSSPMMAKYNDASNTDNAVDTALTLLSDAPTGLFNANGLVNNYNTLFNGKYANLQAQLNILQQFYPTMAKTVLQSPNKDITEGVLKQIKTRVHQDYVQYINTQTGNFAGTTSQPTVPATNSTNSFTPTNTGLQPIQSNFKPLPPNPMLQQ